MEKLDCIIIEDEIPSIEELEYILRECNLNILASAKDGKNGIELCRKLDPDIAFIDINIPVINGMDAAKEIIKKNPLTFIVFITAYNKFALDAFDIGAFDYILKPFDEKRIKHTVKRIYDEYNRGANEGINKILNKISEEEKILKKIPCEENGKVVLIAIDNIIFCYADNGKTYVKTKNKIYYTRYTLHEIEERTELFRVHKSYTVNLDKIKEIYSWFNGTYNVKMDDDKETEIPVSRNNIKELKNQLGL